MLILIVEDLALVADHSFLLTSDPEEIGDFVGLDEINDCWLISIGKGIMQSLQIDGLELVLWGEGNIGNVDLASSFFFNAFLLLNTRIITKNIQREILVLIPFELFKLIDFINQCLTSNSGRIIFFQKTDESSKFEEDVFILFVISHLLENLRCQVSNNFCEKSIILHLFEGMRFNQDKN